MKKSFRRLAPIVLVFIFACFAFGDDFKSETIPSDGTCSACPIRVHGNQFMVIRNFTQDDGSPRGIVTVAKPIGSNPVTVLTAALMTASPPDIINNVVIAGPADVSIMCGTTSGNCFVSYKKKDN